MATKNCTYNGMANFNGGWSPSSGYSKTLDGYIGDGNGYGCVLKFTVPSAPGASSGRSLKVTLDLITLYYSSVTLEYWVTNAGRPDGPNYGDGPPAVQGTTILHGTAAVSGLNTSNWVQKTFTTGATASLPQDGGTYYLWLRCNRNAVVRAATPAFVLNYTATTACTAPDNVRLSASSFGNTLRLLWDAGAGGVGNTLTGYEIQQAIKPAGGSWGSWTAHTVTGASATSVDIDAGGIPRTASVKYRIRTRGAAGSSYYSGWVESGTAYRVPEALGAPTAVKATALFDKTISITWSGAKSQTGNTISSYQLQYRIQHPGLTWGDWMYFGTIPSTSTSGSYLYTPAAVYGEKYQFRVRAQGTAGESYYSGYTESNIAVRNSPPTAPIYLTASSGLITSGGTLTLTWGGAGDVDGNLAQYLLYKSVNGGARQQIAQVASSGASGTYRYTAVESAGAVLVFSIRAVDAMGYTSDYTSSGKVQINAPPSAPTLVTVEETEASRGDVLHIAWSGASDANGNIAGYNVGIEVDDTSWTLASISTNETAGSVAVQMRDDIPDDTDMRIWAQTVDDIGSVSDRAYAQTIVRHIDRNLYVFRDGQRMRKSVYLVRNGVPAKKRVYILRNGTPTQMWARSDTLPAEPLTELFSISAQAGEVTIENSIDGLLLAGTLSTNESLPAPYIEVEAGGRTYPITLPQSMEAGDVYDLQARTLTHGDTVHDAAALGYPPQIACGQGTTKLRSNGLLTIQTYRKAGET